MSRSILPLMFALLYTFVPVSDAKAQSNAKKTVYQHQNWAQYFINMRLSGRWSLNTDVLYRWYDLTGEPFQTGIRTGLTYHFKEPVSVTGGMVYFAHFPTVNDTMVYRPEYRPWQQLMINGKLGRLRLMHRYRFEQRWMARLHGTERTGDYNFLFRARYQLNIQCPINKRVIDKGVFYTVAYNEIFINFGEEVVYNFFDQNRAGIGLGYQLTKSFAVLMGYQYVWQQQRAQAQVYNSTNCVRLSFTHNLDFRRMVE
jgi:hypothetical protein